MRKWYRWAKARPWLIDVVVLLCLLALVFVPPIVHGYWWPSQGDDTADHLAVLDASSIGTIKTSVVFHRYIGQTIAGWGAALFRMVGVSATSFFLWFNFVALYLILAALYLFGRQIVGRLSGVIAVLFVGFTAPGLMVFFGSGTIFNIINLYLLGLLGVLCMVRWLVTDGWHWALVGLGVLAVCMVFHTVTAMYLAVTMLTVLGAVVVWRWRRGGALRRESFVTLLALVCMVGIGLGQPEAKALMMGHIAGVNPIMPAYVRPVEAWHFLLRFVPPWLILTTLATIGIAIWMRFKGWLHFDRWQTVTFRVLGCTMMVMTVATILPQNLDPYRTAIDLSIIVALASALFVGVVMRCDRSKVVVPLLLPIIIMGSVWGLGNYMSYNSCIRPADQQAITWLNENGRSTFSVSSQIAPWIYERFLDMKYSQREGDYWIYRTEHMTPRTDPDYDRFWRGNATTLDDFEGLEELARFDDGEVTVYVFGRPIP